MYSFIITKKADDDFVKIVNYISNELKNIKAADDLSKKIVSSIRDLCIFPNSAPLVINEYFLKKDFRKKVVDNYLILYYLDESKQSIVIVRIIYAKMNLNEIIKMIDI